MATINRKPWNQLNLNSARPDVIKKSQYQHLKLWYMANEIYENKKILYVWFRIKWKNISNLNFCIIILNWPKDTYYFDTSELAKMCLELMFWRHESFVDFHFCDPENEYFSKGHSHDICRVIFDFERFCENLENGSIDFSPMLDNVNSCMPKFY